MPCAGKIIHSGSFIQEKISILLVSPSPDDHSALRRILQNSDWQITRAESISQAAAYLRENTPSVVLVERELPDGNWKDLLNRAVESPSAPLVLVMSRHADDRFWGEVLNLGGYDVLLKPLDCSEVTRVVGMAWRQWTRATVAPKPAASVHTGARAVAHCA